MDVREKLVDVHGKLIGLLQRAPYIRCEDVHRQYAVNWLMNNGVTVQGAADTNVGSKWISVKDRLPEDDSDVLAYLRIGEEGRIYPANYAKGMWFDCIFNTPATETTTHWMPLPQPPKGE